MSVYKVKSEQKVTKIKPLQTVTKINVVNNVNTIIDDNGNGYIRVDFNSGDSVVEIGVIPVNKVIAYTILEVETAGASGIATIGTSQSQGLLMAGADNDLTIENLYINYNNIKTTTNETFNIYFTNNSASGSVTIYYN